MGVDTVPQAGPGGVALDQLFDGTAGKTLAVSVKEEGLGGAVLQLGPDLFQVLLQGVGGGLAEQHPTFLGALALHQDLALVEIDVGQVHARNFGQANPAGIQYFQDGAVPDAVQVFLVRGFHQTHRFLFADEGRQGLFHFYLKAASGRNGAVLEHSLLDQELVEGTQGRQLADDADAGIPFLLLAAGVGVFGFPRLGGQPGQVAAGHAAVHVLKDLVRFVDVADEGVQVSQVDPDGVVGKPALSPKVILVFVKQFMDSGRDIDGVGKGGHAGLPLG